MDGKEVLSTNRIADIHCPNCGAPASYDIRTGVYACHHCGANVTVSDAQEEKRGFRELQQRKLQESVKKYRLQYASCTGCGAKVVFAENEAQANCAFCGRALVRKDYLHSKNIPEIIIPFQITKEEAQECLARWCEKNRRKKEAKLLKEKTGELNGVYLPYEFLRGPIICSVSRYSGGGRHTCGGFLDEVFVNTSSQLDNLLLDGCEPFDLAALTEFDFAYTAGHQVKTDNISGKELERRVCEEVRQSYAPTVRKVLETKAVHIDPDISSVVRMPALLPVYYLSDGELMAAVNGQTGRVSVRALKTSHYYFLPWWLKSVLSTIIISAAAFTGFSLFGMEFNGKLLITAILALFTFIVTLAAYSDTDHMKFRVESGRKIYHSDDEALVRADGTLTKTKLPERNTAPPVFYEKIDGKMQEAVLRFSSPLRYAGMFLLAALVLFLPVIIALFLNGFHFSQLELGGSAVWFCIFVPVIPIYLLKFGRIELYDRPWIYTVSPDGKKIRYKEKSRLKIDWKELVLTILVLLFKPPICLAVWFGIAGFCTICYLTAFGF